MFCHVHRVEIPLYSLSAVCEASHLFMYFSFELLYTLALKLGPRRFIYPSDLRYAKELQKIPYEVRSDFRGDEDCEEDVSESSHTKILNFVQTMMISLSKKQLLHFKTESKVLLIQ
ncbi:hypothetical protein CDAR_568631 [Caerostris darwini]|uniref:Uncharacterized protein n=1 Tax=Caerostris darwini TaxID=1538125 RepID=A0AAV4W3F3_9ARAC|nr:hypothetical protein CDAR_568631 [Caerostris darwini]